MKNSNYPSLISFAALLIGWQVAASWANHSAIFPSVKDLLERLILLAGSADFYLSFLITMGRGFEGFLLASLLALPASIAAHHNPFWKTFFHPLIVILRSVPVIAIVLIALLFIQPLHLPVLIGCITMLPILYQNLISAWKNTDPNLIEMARFFRKSAWKRFRYIYLLQTKQLLFEGAATAIGFGWRAIIIGEVLSSPALGIGSAMKKSQAYIDMPGLLAWTLVAIGGGFLLEFLLKKVARLPLTPSLSVYERAGEVQRKNGRRSLVIDQLAFHRNNTVVFGNFNYTFSNDTFNLLKTPSGSGKTTLLMLLAELLRPNSGHMEFDNIKSTSFSFQDKRLLAQFTVEQNIAFALPDFPLIDSTNMLRLEQLLDVMELKTHRYRLTTELSGGEQQRVTLARALMVPADLLLLDEPLTGIDTLLKNKIIHFMMTDLEFHAPLVIWATHEDPEKILVNSKVINQFGEPSTAIV